MTQEDKELLLKDLSARLPYGVKVQYKGNRYDLTEMHKDGRTYLGSYNSIYGDWHCSLEFEDYPKPYLRPMSSMTEEEKHELYQVFQECPTIIKTFPSYTEFFIYADIINSIDMVNVIDWFNAHHFDYRGLIKKDLALEAPEGMYQIK